MEDRKNPWAAAVASFFIPGRGHLYNGECWLKGWSYLTGRIAFFLLCASLLPSIPRSSGFNLICIGTVPLFLILYVISCSPVALMDTYGAYSTAHNMNTGTIPLKDTPDTVLWMYTIFTDFILLVILFVVLIIVFGCA